MTKVQDLLILNLKRARTRMDFSQIDLAEKAGISLGYIGDIEAGKKFPSATTMQKLVDALGMRPYELFIDDTDHEVPHRHEFLNRIRQDLTRGINGHIDQIIDYHLSNF